MNVFCMGIFYVKANQEKFILSTGEPYGLATLFCNKKKITKISSGRHHVFPSCFIHGTLTYCQVKYQMN